MVVTCDVVLQTMLKNRGAMIALFYSLSGDTSANTKVHIIHLDLIQVTLHDKRSCMSLIAKQRNRQI